MQRAQPAQTCRAMCSADQATADAVPVLQWQWHKLQAALPSIMGPHPSPPSNVLPVPTCS